MDEPIPKQDEVNRLQLTPTDLRRAAAGILDNTMKSASAAILQGGVDLNWEGVHAAIDRAAKLHVMSLRQKGAKVTENA